MKPMALAAREPRGPAEMALTRTCTGRGVCVCVCVWMGVVGRGRVRRAVLAEL